MFLACRIPGSFADFINLNIYYSFMLKKFTISVIHLPTFMQVTKLFRYTEKIYFYSLIYYNKMYV